VATFQYSIRDHNGKIVKGNTEADNESQVAVRLREAGYIITSIKEKNSSRDITISFGGNVKLKDIAIFSRQFATMIQSGISLLRCLEILYNQQEKKAFKTVIGQVKKSVEDGSSISQALADHPKVFPALFINMVRAGEVGGVMDEALQRLAEHFDSEHELKEKVKSATTYPLVISIFAIVVVNVMMIFVVPNFVGMFASLNAELPLITRTVVGISNFMKANYLYMLGITLAFIYIFNRYRKTPEGQSYLDMLVLRIPVFGPMNLKIAVARFTRTLGTLVRSGVPILVALEVTEKTAGNSVVARGIAAARDSIKDGETISKPLAISGIFPPMVIQMIEVGEETGALETMLNRIADFYEREVKFAVEGLTSLIEPLLIIFLALVVGSIVASVMLPMFDIFGQIK
jgi:type IV pilus assembly protein PilC